MLPLHDSLGPTAVPARRHIERGWPTNPSRRAGTGSLRSAFPPTPYSPWRYFESDPVLILRRDCLAQQCLHAHAQQERKHFPLTGIYYIAVLSPGSSVLAGRRLATFCPFSPAPRRLWSLLDPILLACLLRAWRGCYVLARPRPVCQPRYFPSPSPRWSGPTTASAANNDAIDVKTALTVTSFLAIALYNVVELNFIILATFKQRRGLYFWSFVVATWAIAPCAVGFLIKYLQLSNLSTLYVTLIVLGWSAMVTGQSVVLYSRAAPGGPQPHPAPAGADHDHRQCRHLPHTHHRHGLRGQRA